MTPIIDLLPPPRVYVTLDQGTGSAARPVVTPGALVARGELIACADDERSSNLHAPVAGRVIALTTAEDVAASDEDACIVIEREPSPAQDLNARQTIGPANREQPVIDPACIDPAELVRRLREAGIAGLGGAAFPTATKLAAARAHAVQSLVINGAECEPWISCDDALLQTAAAEVVLGSSLLQRATGATNCIIAIEDDKPAAIAAIQAALADASTTVSLIVVPAVYPRGAERQLITAVTGIEVPSGLWPVAAGVVCQNVATAAAVARWAMHGEPLLSRIVTVTGSGVARPCNVRAPIGTPIAALIEAAGGYRGAPLRLIAGGNMTGRALPSDAIGLTKAMNCLFVATRADIGARLDAVERPCIRCGDCAQVCPAGLLPQQLHRAALVDDHATLLQLGAHDCIDCGLCDYVCPSQIPLAQRFRSARQSLSVAAAAAARATANRERYELRQERLRDAADAKQRLFDEVRQRARQAHDPDEPGRGGTS